jgi:hypothetical protein
MDVITAGDFSITNHGGRTVFSFRVPSMSVVDYVAQHNAAMAANAVATQQIQQPVQLAQALPRFRAPKPKRQGKQHGKNKRKK